MALVGQVRVEQSGDVGGLGWSVFHAQNAGGGAFSGGDANSFGAALQSLYFALRALFPTDLTFSVEPIVKMLDVATGHLNSEVPMSSVPVAVVGTATETYAAGTGIRGYWHTGTIRGTRLVRGATFFTPITSNDYTTGGLISTVSTSGTQSAMASWIATMLGPPTTMPVLPTKAGSARRKATAAGPTMPNMNE